MTPDRPVPSTVVFDLGGVLTAAPFRFVDEYCAELALPAGTLSSYFRGDEVFQAVERGEVTFRDFLKSVGTRVQAAHGVRIDVRRLAADAERAGHLQPEMLALLHRLHAHGTRLGLLTNNVKEATIWRAELPAELFDTVLDSSAVGLRKPDPALYRQLLAELGCTAADVVYVDDFEENLPPAAELGMTAVWFQGADDLVERLTSLGVVA